MRFRVNTDKLLMSLYEESGHSGPGVRRGDETMQDEEEKEEGEKDIPPAPPAAPPAADPRVAPPLHQTADMRDRRRPATRSSGIAIFTPFPFLFPLIPQLGVML